MRLTRRARSLLASSLLATTAGCTIAAATVDASANSPVRAVAQCRINFQASSLNLRIGQDLVLTWVAIGADKLTASWTSGFVPFAGAVTTTMNRAGTFSYQLTGTSRGQYCGGSGLEVAFTGGAPSHASTSTVPNSGSNGGGTTPPVNGSSNNGGTTNGGGSNGGTNDGVNGGSNNGGSNNGVGAAARPGSAKFPAQSPTSGSGVPWYQQPLNLLTIAALALICSLALLKREPLRATFVHRH